MRISVEYHSKLIFRYIGKEASKKILLRLHKNVIDSFQTYSRKKSTIMPLYNNDAIIRPI